MMKSNYFKISTCLLIAACLAGCGGGGNSSGDSNQIIQLTTAQGQQLWNAGNSSAVLYGQLMATNTPEQVRPQVISSLKNTPGVVGAGVTADGHTIWFQMDSGATAYICHDASDTSSKQVISGRNVSKAAQSTIGPTRAITISNQSTRSSRASGPDSLVIPNRGGAIFLDPFSFLTQAGIASVTSNLQNIGYGNSEINILQGDQVKLTSLAALSGYSLIVYFGHGAVDRNGYVRILIPSIVGPPIGQTSYDPDAKWGWYPIPGQSKPIAGYVVDAAWLKRSNLPFQKSVVFLDACDTMYEPSFANAFGTTSIVFGWLDEVQTVTDLDATEQVLNDFQKPDLSGNETAARIAKAHWSTHNDNSGVGGISAGSDSICLVPSLTGSWFGTMNGSLDQAGAGDTSWGLVFDQYGPASQGASGHLTDFPMSHVTLSHRGLQFDAQLSNAPNGWTPPQFNSGLFFNGGTMHGSLADDGTLTVNVSDSLGQTGTWTGQRKSASDSYDTTAPTLVSVSPPDGSVIAPGTVNISLQFSKPIGVDGTWALYISNVAMHVIGGGPNAPNVWTISWSVAQVDPSQPASIELVGGGFSDIWGNILYPGAGLHIASWTIPATKGAPKSPKNDRTSNNPSRLVISVGASGTTVNGGRGQ